MKTGVWTLVLMGLAIALALVLHQYSGNVLILIPPWRIELSLTLAVMLGLMLFLVTHTLLRLLRWLTHSPQRLRTWRGVHVEQRDHMLLESGWRHALEGRYAQAQKDLSKLVTHAHTGQRQVLAYVTLAQVQHQCGQYDQRDQTLERARAAANTPQLQAMLAITSATLLLAQGQAQAALSWLQPLQDAKARHPLATQLLLQAYHQLGQVDQVYTLTRLLQKRGTLDKPQAHQYIEASAATKLAQGGTDQFKSIWGDLKSDEKTRPAIALQAARILATQGDWAASERVLELALQAQFDAPLLSAYAQCPPERVAHRLQRAESWLKPHPEHAPLYAALGHLCLTGELWGQAERYLQRSLQLHPDPRVHALLGALYNRLQRPEEAVHQWRLAAGVGDTTLRPTAPILPAADTRNDPTLLDVEIPESTSFAIPTDYPIEPATLKEKNES